MPSLQSEKIIWANWNLRLHSAAIPEAPSNQKMTSPSRWIPLPPGNYKINFDEASKWNPGRVGYGGIFTTSLGQVYLLYFVCLRWDTNKSTELEGLLQGLILAREHHLFPLIIEGDSQILINMAK